MESFASRTASSSPSKGRMATTGPNTSSRMIRISGRTPTQTAGGGKFPAEAGGAPPRAPAARAAVLAGVIVDGEDRRLHAGLEVGVREHQAGRFAAQLQRNPLDPLGGLRHHMRASLCRPRER